VDTSDADISKLICEYLAERPLAMDNLEGIAEWWLTRQQIRVNVTTLARVVAEMMRAGVLEQLGPADAPRYRLATSRTRENGES
jgi:hypothetical protein